MTNGEHDSLWIDGARALPIIANQLRVTNGIAICKELYNIGELSKEDYVASLNNMMKSSGLVMTK